MSKRLLRLLAALLTLTLLAAACGDDDDADTGDTTTTVAEGADEGATDDESMDEGTDDEAMDDESMDEGTDDGAMDEGTDDGSMDEGSADEPGTIVDVAVANGSFTTLVAAVEAAGLAETLSGEGPFTVFAPTDDAFAAALEALELTAEELLADTETLTSILTYHVLPIEADAATAISLDGQSVETVNGAEIAISVVDGSVVLNADSANPATVVTPDVMASNGIIHVIDAVILPPA